MATRISLFENTEARKCDWLSTQETCHRLATIFYADFDDHFSGWCRCENHIMEEFGTKGHETLVQLTASEYFVWEIMSS
jgi:hypothetical protein